MSLEHKCQYALFDPDVMCQYFSLLFLQWSNCFLKTYCFSIRLNSDISQHLASKFFCLIIPLKSTCGLVDRLKKGLVFFNTYCEISQRFRKWSLNIRCVIDFWKLQALEKGRRRMMLVEFQFSRAAASLVQRHHNFQTSVIHSPNKKFKFRVSRCHMFSKLFAFVAFLKNFCAVLRRDVW